MRVRPTSKKYTLSKHRFYELQHFCLQYNEWKDELERLEPAPKGISTEGSSGGQGTGSPTEALAIRRAMLSQKMDIIEETAREVGLIKKKSGDMDISKFILKAVTNENITYNYLDMVMNIPVGRDTFYARKRMFYYTLARKLDKENSGQNEN